MNFPITIFCLGSVLVLTGAAMATALLPSLILGDGAWLGIGLAALATTGVGLAMRRFTRSDEPPDMTIREGFAIAAFGWFFVGVLGTLPYLFTGTIPSVVDALFESLSGFTTTGATILTDIEKCPAGVLYWRSLTQWLGGMGIIVLAVAIMPLLGVGGMQLFRAEVPGPVKDRLLPRIQDTAKLLYGVYVGLTVLCAVAYWLAGMRVFDAVCHALTCLATGGFSTKNASLAAYGAPVHWISIAFMFVAGVNYSLHYFALRGRLTRYAKNEEFVFYAMVTVLAAGFLAGCVALPEGSTATVRDALFTTVSIVTTTGFGTADFETWPLVTQFLILALMFFGACAGSTAGGFKCVRVLLVFKQAYVMVFRYVHPHAMKHVKFDQKVVGDDVMNSVMGLLCLIIVVTGAATLVMVGMGMDIVSGASAVVTCLNNIGPGLGTVGPTDNFAGVPTLGKLLLSLLMVMGRLELFTVFVLFLPSFWRR